MEIQFNFNLLDLRDYEYILESIDVTLLKKMFLTSCEKVDSKSKYYLGKNCNGRFWNGFRISSITSEKIIKSIVDDIKKKSKDMDYKSFITYVVDKQFNIKSNDINKIKEDIIKINKIKSIESLFKLLNINDINSEIIDAIKIKNIKEEYETKIAKIEKNLNESFASKELFLKKENEKLKKEIYNLNKLCDEKKSNLNKEIAKIKKEYNDLLLLSKLKDEELKKMNNEFENLKNNLDIINDINKRFSIIIDEKIRSKIINYIIKENYETKVEIKDGIKNLISELIDNIGCKRFDEIIIELYVLNRILEG